VRVGLYFQLTDNIKKKHDGKLPTQWSVICALTSGAIGAFVGNPADLSLVRFQADSSLPPDQRRNYKNVFDALSRIVREEGFTSLWRGVGPTIGRAVSLNIAMMVSYDKMKEKLNKQWGDNFKSTFVSTFVSGFFTATCSLPMDNVKTKIQKQKPDVHTGRLPYDGILDCM
jgi:solute carrier family 25 oxoglutarate transporter 11